jgi:hypothetical protein
MRRVGSVVVLPCCLSVVLGVALLGGVALNVDGAGAEVGSGQRLPVLAPYVDQTTEHDTPTPVRARMIREAKAALARIRAASKLPRTRVAGCEPAQIGEQRYLGPPAPQVSAMIIGLQVEIVFSFKHLPASDACRPFGLSTVVSGPPIRGHHGSAAIDRYRIRGSRGRVVSDLPYYSKAPYRLLVIAETILGQRSRYIEVPLRCPGTRDLVKGCLPGPAPSLHARFVPKPVLPLRGVDRASLEATLRYVIADERTATPTRVRCVSLRSCEITYVDPDFLNSPYRVAYRVAGQQLGGCWTAWRQATLDEPPYEGAWHGRLRLAGCVSWLQ